MKISNIKVKTPHIPSRTAACQFIAQHGYDMEWVPAQGLFYVHDVEKDKLHGIPLSEVTNFTLDVKPEAFMRQLRAYLAASGEDEPAKVRRGPGRPPKSAEPSPDGD